VSAWEHIQRRLGECERLAVTPEQIVGLGLPTRPSRAAKFDGESVEVDAVPSPVRRRLVEEASRPVTGQPETAAGSPRRARRGG
jgi:hypothetical protein